MNTNAPTRPVNLLWVEDHPLYRQGLAELLRTRLPEVRCESAGTAAQALARLADADAAFDWLLTDLRLPDRDGWHLLAEARRRWPRLSCAVLSGEDSPASIERARQWGCRGFVPKSTEPEPLCDLLRGLLAGERHFPPAPPARAASSAAAAPLHLTERQRAVLRGLARGRTSRAIAEELGIAERTVKDHLAVLYGRLDVGSRAEAVARAAALGLLELEAADLR